MVPRVTGECSIADYDCAQEGNRALCPACQKTTLDENGLFIVDVVNEGGFSGAVDLGAIFDRDRWEEEQPEDWKKGQALLSFCQSEQFEEAEELLRDEGTDPNVAYEDGMTGLHLAAANNSLEWAALLLRYGANKNIENDEGKTPLDYAILTNAEQVITLLRT
ncbi:hypothetical protein H0H93_011432 [Arthromyces matolae]|nr:hypothetical protein H0H93_011432 [Arthromyces matolae]